MKKTILFLIVIATIASGCKKYEEGPCISFRSAEKRLYGTYRLITYTTNGEDSLNLYCDSLGNFLEFYFDKGDIEIKLGIAGNRNDGEYTLLACGCSLTNHNTILSFEHCGGDLGTGPFTPTSTRIQWEILRLTSKELKMKTFYHNKEYIVVLKKFN
jgi:hypothetical protein